MRSGLIRPTNFNVCVVEVWIIRVTAMMARHAFGQGGHPDFVPLINDTAKCLQFNKSVEHVDNRGLLNRTHVMNT